MARSQWKGPWVHPSLMRKLRAIEQGEIRQPITTWARGSTIIPQFIGVTFRVHHGNGFTPVRITEQMIGHKLGEFAPTRKSAQHSAALRGKTKHARSK